MRIVQSFAGRRRGGGMRVEDESCVPLQKGGEMRVEDENHALLCRKEEEGDESRR